MGLMQHLQALQEQMLDHNKWVSILETNCILLLIEARSYSITVI